MELGTTIFCGAVAREPSCRAQTGRGGDGAGPEPRGPEELGGTVPPSEAPRGGGQQASVRPDVRLRTSANDRPPGVSLLGEPHHKARSPRRNRPGGILPCNPSRHLCAQASGHMSCIVSAGGVANLAWGQARGGTRLLHTRTHQGAASRQSAYAKHIIMLRQNAGRRSERDVGPIVSNGSWFSMNRSESTLVFPHDTAVGDDSDSSGKHATLSITTDVGDDLELPRPKAPE